MVTWYSYNGIWKLNDVSTVTIRNQWLATKKFYGWIGAGTTGPASGITSVSRLQYATDTFIMALRGNLTYSHTRTGAVASNTSGWWMGGGAPGALPAAGSTYIERLIFATDTTLATLRGNLATAAGQSTNTYNTTDAWQTGGATALTTVQRMIYASDTANATAKGPLSYGRQNLGTNSDNSADGWIGGGATPATPSLNSTVDRIIFGSDTATAVAKGPLSAAVYRYCGGMSTSSNGYFSGGTDGTNARSTVDKIIFSSDTAAAVAKGPLTTTRQYAVSGSYNQNYGYTYISNTPTFSNSNRIDFASDTATALDKAFVPVYSFANGAV